MGSYSTALLIVMVSIIALTILVLLLALFRESLFWYWRSKGVMQPPEDILSKPHETALLIKKSIAQLKSEESQKRANERR